MSDIREAILVRLVEVVGTIPNLRSSHRNNVDVPENQLPAAIVFDADEETIAGNTSNRRSDSPIKVEMTPEIVIAQQSNGDGSNLAMWRTELIKRVLTDTELNALVAKGAPRGDAAIHFDGLQTDYGWMRSLHGALRAQITFKYWLKPNEL